MAERLLIIGAGMACAYLLRQLHQQRHSYAITVVGDEAEACYNRVLLSRLLAGESTATDLAMLAATAASERLDFVTSCRVVSFAGGSLSSTGCAGCAADRSSIGRRQAGR